MTVVKNSGSCVAPAAWRKLLPGAFLISKQNANEQRVCSWMHLGLKLRRFGKKAFTDFKFNVQLIKKNYTLRYRGH